MLRQKEAPKAPKVQKKVVKSADALKEREKVLKEVKKELAKSKKELRDRKREVRGILKAQPVETQKRIQKLKRHIYYKTVTKEGKLNHINCSYIYKTWNEVENRFKYYTMYVVDRTTTDLEDYPKTKDMLFLDKTARDNADNYNEDYIGIERILKKYYIKQVTKKQVKNKMNSISYRFLEELNGFVEPLKGDNLCVPRGIIRILSGKEKFMKLDLPTVLKQFEQLKIDYHSGVSAEEVKKWVM